MTGFIQNIKLHGGAIRLIYLACLLSFISTSYAQTVDGIQPPDGRIIWVGSEPECHYPNLQEAVENAYDCGPFGCPPGIARIRLTANYNHSGFTLLNKNLKIQGGYSSCQGNFTGVNKTISAIDSGSRLFAVTASQSGTTQVDLQNLSMFGTTGNAIQGGVIVMGAGEVTLRLIDSIVSSGTAEEGGGIAMLGDGNVLEIQNSEITDNQAINGSFSFGDGGGIYCENGGSINLISGNIHDNEADRRGGGIVLDNCQLIGNTENKHRFIQNNTVLRSTADNASGQGGGIFATGNETLISLGALFSRTFISNNRVVEWQPDTSQSNIATAGGLLLRLGASASLTNVQFIANSAPDGGGVSLETGSFLEMDRTTGPCDPTQQQQCSAFIDNEATGGGDTSGSGSAIYSHVEDNGSSISIKRTVFRGNDGYHHNGEGGFGSMIFIAYGVSLLEGNLMFLNSLEDDTGVFNDRYGVYLQFFGDGSADLIQNTITFNENSGAVLRIGGTMVNAIGNLIFDPAQEFDIMDNDSSDQTIYSACNITSAELIDTVVNGGANDVVSDPGFVDSTSANFKLVSSSPAINRCDEQGGAIDMSFDILGRFRPIVNGPNNDGLGNYDAGAFEYHINTGGDVDLQANLNLETSIGSFGAEFKAQLRNIGMNPARHQNAYILFEKPTTDYSTAGNWNCSEQVIDGIDMVECNHQITGSGEIPVLGYSSPLTVNIMPDAFLECALAIFAESRGLDRDTDLSNNSVDFGSTDCQQLDLIFKNGFE